MTTTLLLDTGPLVAFLDSNDSYRAWARSQFEVHRPPLLTCEAVLAEAIYLLKRNGFNPSPIFTMLRRGALLIPFALAEHEAQIEALMTRYNNVPMDLADACLVCMSEMYPNSSVLTLDTDFAIYRRFANKPVPTIAPWHTG